VLNLFQSKETLDILCEVCGNDALSQAVTCDRLRHFEMGNFIR
jgi:hypothetical protein